MFNRIKFYFDYASYALEWSSKLVKVIRDTVVNFPKWGPPKLESYIQAGGPDKTNPEQKPIQANDGVHRGGIESGNKPVSKQDIPGTA